MQQATRLNKTYFLQHCTSPPAKPAAGIQLAYRVWRKPLYVAGRYLKLLRGVAQVCSTSADYSSCHADIERELEAHRASHSIVEIELHMLCPECWSYRQHCSHDVTRQCLGHMRPWQSRKHQGYILLNAKLQ